MAILAIVLLYVIGLALAAFYGCLSWFLPISMVLGTLGLIGWAAWALSGHLAGGGVAARAWWTANQRRVTIALVVFAILATLVATAYHTRSKWLPPCAAAAAGTPDCPATTVTPVAEETGSPDPTPLRSKVITVTRDWSPAEMIPDGERVKWTRLDRSVTYEVRTSVNTAPVLIPGVNQQSLIDRHRVPDTESVQFRVTDPNKEEVQMRLDFFPYRR